MLTIIVVRQITNWKLGYTPSLFNGIATRSLYFIFLISCIMTSIKKHRGRAFTNRNKILRSIALIMTIVWNYWALAAATLIMLVSLAETVSEGKPKFKENAEKTWTYFKIVLPFALILIAATATIAIAHYIPESMLPKSNAVMSKWQNPIFTEELAGNRFAIAMYSLVFYLKLLFVPNPLRYYYGYRIIPDVGLDNPIVILSIIVYLALIVVAIWLFNRRNPISYGILFYLIGIFPFSNLFFPFTGIIGERMLFAPSIGFAIAIGYLIILIFRATGEINKQKAIAIYGLVALLVLPNVFACIHRNAVWKDRETLFGNDMKYLDESAKANVLYANLLSRKVYDNPAKMNAEKSVRDIKNAEKMGENFVRLRATH